LPAVQAGTPPSNGLSIVIPSRPSQPTQSFGLPASQADQEAVEGDLEVDDDTLAREYDVADGVAESIFGALDTGGLEDENEDEELDDFDDLDNDGMVFRSLFFLLELELNYYNTYFQRPMLSSKQASACQLLKEPKPIEGLGEGKHRNPLSSHGT
jgi:hypothetical protein